MSNPNLDSLYRDLWVRMKRVVDAYTRTKRLEEADYCMIDFFTTFDDVEELERHVEIAEDAALESGAGS